MISTFTLRAYTSRGGWWLPPGRGSAQVTEDQAPVNILIECFWRTTLLLLCGLQGNLVVLAPGSQSSVAPPGWDRPLWALPWKHIGRLRKVPSRLVRKPPIGSRGQRQRAWTSQLLGN